jgi:hypothetical protein
MSKRKPDVNGQQGEQVNTQPVDQANEQQGELVNDQPVNPQPESLMKQLEVGLPSRRRRRPPAPPPEPLQLDPEFVNSPDRMQYALLLALLLRQKNGTTTFSQKDLDHTDTEYNILFARTLDGRGLEVTVVSSESGIIRSPAKQKEVEQWQKDQDMRRAEAMAYQPLPPPSKNFLMNSTFVPGAVLGQPATGENPGGGVPRETAGFPVQFPPGANPGSGFAIPQVPPQQRAEVIQLPNPGPQATTDGSDAYHFPFQVGTNPQNAVGPSFPGMNLSQVHQQLLEKDQQVQSQELEAIARQEKGE